MENQPYPLWTPPFCRSFFSSAGIPVGSSGMRGGHKQWLTGWSMDWFKGKFTGKPHNSWENQWFPAIFPSNQYIEFSLLRINHGWELSRTKFGEVTLTIFSIHCEFVHCHVWLSAGNQTLKYNWGFPKSWGYPNSWMVFVRENPIEMDENWGYPHFRKPPTHFKFKRIL